MELFHEALPFLIGLVLPPVMLLLSRFLHLERTNRPLSFVLAILVGCCVSFFSGELAVSMADGMMAIIIDSSLVYTGSQLAYHLCWKPLLAQRLAHQATKSQIS